eukprot:403331426
MTSTSSSGFFDNKKSNKSGAGNQGNSNQQQYNQSTGQSSNQAEGWANLFPGGQPSQSKQQNQQQNKSGKYANNNSQQNIPNSRMNANLKTDAQISSSNSTGKRMERTLQKFNFGDTNNTLANSNSNTLASTGGLHRNQTLNKSQSGNQWRRNTVTGGALGSLEDDDDGQEFNQFAGKKSTYDESLYTTRIDENKVSQDIKQYASQMEKEILNSSAGGNRHIAEERNQLELQDNDIPDKYAEEMLYSGVYRNNNNESSQKAPTQQQAKQSQVQQNIHTSSAASAAEFFDKSQSSQQQQLNKSQTMSNQSQPFVPSGKGKKQQQQNTQQQVQNQQYQSQYTKQGKKQGQGQTQNKSVKFILRDTSKERQNVVEEMMNTFIDRKKQLQQSKVESVDKAEDPIKTLIVPWKGDKQIKAELQPKNKDSKVVVEKQQKQPEHEVVKKQDIAPVQEEKVQIQTENKVQQQSQYLPQSNLANQVGAALNLKATEFKPMKKSQPVIEQTQQQQPALNQSQNLSQSTIIQPTQDIQNQHQPSLSQSQLIDTSYTSTADVTASSIENPVINSMAQQLQYNIADIQPFIPKNKKTSTSQTTITPTIKVEKSNIESQQEPQAIQDQTTNPVNFVASNIPQQQNVQQIQPSHQTSQLQTQSQAFVPMKKAPINPIGQSPYMNNQIGGNQMHGGGHYSGQGGVYNQNAQHFAPSNQQQNMGGYMPQHQQQQHPHHNQPMNNYPQYYPLQQQQQNQQFNSQNNASLNTQLNNDTASSELQTSATLNTNGTNLNPTAKPFIKKQN